jgi:hypothetical protein
VIAQRFPNADSGDLSPGATFALSMAAEDAIREWIANNVATQENDVAVGYRFALFRPVDRFPDFVASSGLTGVVTAVDESGVWARMDQPITGAGHWDNQVHWDTPEAFAHDSIPA